MDAIAAFRKENEISRPSGDSSHHHRPSSGMLLLAGCVDWDNMTSKSPEGLASLFEVTLSSRAVKSFSSSSSMHLFVLTEDGKVFGLGKNDHGQLGCGNLDTQQCPVEIHLPSIEKVQKIACGRAHSLVLTSAGEVWGCGSNISGQLGLGAGKAVVRDHTEFVKLSLQNIVDIGCGDQFSVCCDTLGRVFTFGHPEYGQLGHGSTGEFIQRAGKVEYSCEFTPKLVETFVVKDGHGKVVSSLSHSEVRISAVSAGKNHVVCMEGGSSHVSGSSDSEPQPIAVNRLFSWGFGGYGRLGHNCSDNELIPRFPTTMNISYDRVVHIVIACTREISWFTSGKPSLQKKISSLFAGTTYSLAVSANGSLYFWGKLSNSPRGEATIYPKVVQELYDYKVFSARGGSNCVVVAAETAVVAWGAPVAGKIGLDGDVNSCTTPRLVSALDGYTPVDVSCGYGHICYIAESKQPQTGRQFPIMVFPSKSKKSTKTEGESKRKGAAATAGGGSKKRKT